MSRRFLFYITQNYSFEILRPLQQAIEAQGDECVWYAHGGKVNRNNFAVNETQLSSIQAAVDYQPDATFVPGNIVPDFVPGLKIQVFHGLEYKKKGHFGIRGFYDLYCTHGPKTTDRFKQLAAKHKYFRVVETGWPKLDTLFSAKKLSLPEQKNRPCILYAPTFSPALTSAVELLPEISKRIALASEYWIFKFHPKMDADLLRPYQKLAEQNENVHFSLDSSISPSLQTADIILSDTSSVIGEFLLLNKPAVTYKNSQPGEELVNFTNASSLAENLALALSPSDELKHSIIEANKLLHPFDDGKSSQRILEAVEEMLIDKRAGLTNKPLNLFRRFKMRKLHKYWRL